jgi:hypothetical protein
LWEFFRTQVTDFRLAQVGRRRSVLYRTVTITEKIGKYVQLAVERYLTIAESIPEKVRRPTLYGGPVRDNPGYHSWQSFQFELLLKLLHAICTYCRDRPPPVDRVKNFAHFFLILASRREVQTINSLRSTVSRVIIQLFVPTMPPRAAYHSW